MEWQVVGSCKIGNKGCVFFSSIPDAVMNVHHGECYSQGCPLIEEAAEKSYGVGSPGDRYSDPLPGMEEVVP
jgi:hypothetical protein